MSDRRIETAVRAVSHGKPFVEVMILSIIQARTVANNITFTVSWMGRAAIRDGPAAVGRMGVRHACGPGTLERHRGKPTMTILQKLQLRQSEIRQAAQHACIGNVARTDAQGH